jgi:methyl-accepting chemotaxis protein
MRLDSMTLKNKLMAGFLVMAALTAVTGLAGFYFTSSVGERGTQVGERLAPLGNAAMEIKLTATRAHLLFEEIVGGDTSEDINEVWSLLDQTLWYTNAILNGGENEKGKFYPSQSPAVREKIEDVRDRVQKFIESGKTRYAHYSSLEGAGSKADQQFDATYDEIQALLDQVLTADTGSLEQAGNGQSILRSAGRAKYLLANGHLFLEEILAGDQSEKIEEIMAEFAAAKKEAETLRGTSFADAADKIISGVDTFIGLAEQRFATLKNSTRAGSEADEAFDTTYENFISVADEAEILIRADMTTGLAQAIQFRQTATFLILGILALAFVLAAGMAFLISRGVSRKVSILSKEMESLSEGYIGTQISFADDKDEIGSMARVLQDFRLTGVRATRAQSAVEAASAQFMIVDADNEIVDLNAAAIEMFRGCQSALRVDMADFDVEKLIGTSFDRFEARVNSNDETGEDTESLIIGDRVFHITRTATTSERGEALGWCIEWKDMTEQLAVEQGVSRIVFAAGEGDFSQRLSEQGKNGFMLDLARGINEFVIAVDNGLTETVNVLSAMADGDISQRISGEYKGRFRQLKEDANRMGEQVGLIAARITEASSSVHGATNEISVGVSDLSTRTEHQASSLEETAASMEELAATVRQNSDNAQEANQVASAAREAATSGGEVTNDAVAAMQRIEQSSRQISEIVGLIEEIAFQTNLLALNAAVEAARAGDAGRGFAVVANEVRALAQRSADASKEIKELIANSDSQVRNGVELVNKAGGALNEIVTSVKKVADYVSEIAAASREQTGGIDQVSRAITSMEEMTQQNGALVEQTTAALRSAQEQVSDLRNVVGFFKTGKAPSGSVWPEDDNAKGARQDNPVLKQQSMVRQAMSGVAAAASGGRPDLDWQEF